ncbi:efflux RND transporter permease subunit [Aliiglaciecola sp. CAU 1673]|uniref:efflux RND transporter permease subunit n=1 Tax=Aliiglaciecola sp. CAU 1673 TaxID=3032595 RepID=UPI0023DAA28F|nr:efflux RND transporter permease subunit [Aliiglaciecola sp. CAU 1673]MDF2178173.1 efflux RND transporter permease subunit [Aliiglaciecola sp. CAU 1673]
MNKFESMGAGLAEFAIRRPVTVGMFFFSMLLLGLIASRLLPLEKFPGIDIPEMMVVIPYQDATPAEVEKMVTKPVEEALATMSGIKRLSSTSNEDGAEIHIEFSWDENISAKSIEAREKVDAIRHLLPTDVERILVYQFNTSDMPIFQLRVSSERDLSNAYDLLDRNLKMPIERVPGVSKVELYGVLKKQIAIRLDSERIAALHIDVNQLTTVLRDANFSMSAGHFVELNQKIMVNPQGEFRSKEEIEDLIVQQGIRLKDIADIGYETPRRTEGRHLDRTYAVGLNIFRESGSNLVEVSKAVLKVVDEANDSPAFNGINLFIMQDEAKSVTDSLGDLLNAGLVGALLSVIVLYLFLRQVASTLIVVLSVPFSICIALGCMYFMGYSLNILSLMGLMLAVGMLVDNAVVVTESIFQEKEHDKDPLRATRSGVSKVSLAMIAGTATTAIVFLPNIVGAKVNVTVFLEHVAIAICISLFASLLLAQTLIPLLTTKLKQTTKPKDDKPSRWKTWYHNVLQWTLAHQGKTVLIAVAILLSTAIPMGVVSGDEDNENPNNQLWLNYNIQGNFTMDEVEKEVNRMEEYLYANQEKFHIKQVYSFFNAGFAVSGITLNDDVPVHQNVVKEMIKKDFPSLVRSEPSFQWNQSNGGVRLTLLGQSSEALMRIADQIVPVLEQVEGLTDVRADINSQKEELQVRIDRQKAFRFGLSAEDVANVIATALRGSNLRTFRHGDTGEVDIRLMFDESLQHSLEELKRLTIKRDDTQNVTLDMVADISVAPRLSEIQRHYRQTALGIGANLKEGTSLDQARERIESIMSNIELPAGYKWTLDGSFQRQNQNEAVMQTNMLLAVCMIYVVMAALFESLLLPTAVITSLLFSFTGVFWAFMLTGTNMSIMGMIGMLILMGIVVNNGIVLVDRINQLINEGHHVIDAILEGCMSRVRPILMTVATTVLGLVPLALGNTQIGGDGPPYSPMAIAIIGGLMFSTVTSLFLLPLTYLLLLKLRRNTAHMVQDSKRLVGRLIKAT